MNLTDLRALTKQLLGQRVVTSTDDATWYIDRVNSGYRRLATFQGFVTTPSMKTPSQRILRFHELESMTARTLNGGAFPTSRNFVQPAVSSTLVYSMLDVYDRSNDRWLQRIPIKYMRRLNPDENGTPLRWTPGGDGANPQAVGYYVHPKPTAASAEEIDVYEYAYRYPAALTGTDSPIIPEVWHPAIAFAAAAEGALLLDMPERHTELEQRFMSYIAERKSPYEEGSYAGGRRYFNVG